MYVWCKLFHLFMVFGCVVVDFFFTLKCNKYKVLSWCNKLHQHVYAHIRVGNGPSNFWQCENLNTLFKAKCAFFYKMSQRLCAMRRFSLQIHLKVIKCYFCALSWFLWNAGAVKTLPSFCIFISATVKKNSLRNMVTILIISAAKV